MRVLRHGADFIPLGQNVPKMRGWTAIQKCAILDFPAKEINWNCKEVIGMNRNRMSLSVVLFLIGFIVTYVILCFVFAGGIKWALEATPTGKIVANIRYMALLKSIVSLIVGLIAGALPGMKGRKK